MMERTSEGEGELLESEGEASRKKKEERGSEGRKREWVGSRELNAQGGANSN